MNAYLLDTNIVGHYFCGHANVIAKIESLSDETPLLISAITHGEVMFGHAITWSTNHQKRADFERFLNNEFPTSFTLAVTRHTRMHYGDLKAELFRRFPPLSKKQNHPERCFDHATGSELGIDENDLWIAAQAIERNVILVTNDEMLRIREVAGNLLTVEDWTQPI